MIKHCKTLLKLSMNCKRQRKSKCPENALFKWMDDLRVYVLCYNISVLSGRWLGDNETMCAMEPRLCLEIFPTQVRLVPRTARSVGQRLAH